MAASDITSLIDAKASYCVNVKGDSLAGLLGGAGSGVRSDADDEMIITLALRNPARLTSLALVAPGGGGDGPTAVKVWMYRPAFSFDDRDSPAGAEAALAPGACAGPGGAEVKLKPTTFVNVHSLTLLLSRGGEGDAVALAGVRLVGWSTTATKDLAGLRKAHAHGGEGEDG